MVRLVRKEKQYQEQIFGGAFAANKPVFGRGGEEVFPYSCLFYWSHGRALADNGFPLHAHQGFEILSFLWEGSIRHFDTLGQIWTPLYAGDFQVIQSNSGVSHQEQVSAGSRMFQIWLDPHYTETLKEVPDYQDYRLVDCRQDTTPAMTVVHYVGQGSVARLRTPGVSIRNYFCHGEAFTFHLSSDQTYSFYVLSGEGSIGDYQVKEDDFVRVESESALTVYLQGQLFCIQSPSVLTYPALSQRGIFR